MASSVQVSDVRDEYQINRQKWTKKKLFFLTSPNNKNKEGNGQKSEVQTAVGVKKAKSQEDCEIVVLGIVRGLTIVGPADVV